RRLSIKYLGVGWGKKRVHFFPSLKAERDDRGLRHKGGARAGSSNPRRCGKRKCAHSSALGRRGEARELVTDRQVNRLERLDQARTAQDLRWSGVVHIQVDADVAVGSGRGRDSVKESAVGEIEGRYTLQ